MKTDEALRDHVLFLLKEGGAHLTFEQAVAGIPPGQHGAKPAGQPHTPWRLLEHMRLCVWDILEFCRNPQHVSPEFPDGYWPKDDAPPSAMAWEQSLAAFRADMQAVEEMVADPQIDLLAKIPHGQGQTYLREALLVADHNAYHLGQLVLLRRLLGEWQDE